MEPRKWTWKHTLVVVFFIIFLGFRTNLRVDDNTYDYRDLGFPGYAGHTRIPPVNLTAIRETAESNGLEIPMETEIDHETFRDPIFLGIGVFNLDHHPYDNHTRYHLKYQDEVLNEFWVKLGYYMNLTDSELDEEIRYFNETRDIRDFVGRSLNGKPCWDRIIQDQEKLMEYRTSEIGQVHLEFNRQIKIRLNTDKLGVEKRTVVNGSKIRCGCGSIPIQISKC